MMFRCLIGLLCILNLFVYYGHADTDAFALEHGFLYPSGFDQPYRGQNQTGAVFQNPARLSGATTQQFRIDSMQDFIGYSRVSGVYVLPTNIGEFGIGFSRFYADDLTNNTLDAEGIPLEGNRFSETNEKISVFYGDEFFPGIHLGVGASYFQHSIHDASANTFFFDLGLAWDVNDALQLGLYSAQLFQSPFEWNTGLEENLPSRIIVEGMYRWEEVQATLSSNFDLHRGELAYAVHPMLQVFTDVVYGDDLHRTGFGAVVYVGPVSVQYTRLRYDDSGLGVDQDLLGLMVTFGEPLHIELGRK